MDGGLVFRNCSASLLSTSWIDNLRFLTSRGLMLICCTGAFRPIFDVRIDIIDDELSILEVSLGSILPISDSLWSCELRFPPSLGLYLLWKLFINLLLIYEPNSLRLDRIFLNSLFKLIRGDLCSSTSSLSPPPSEQIPPEIVRLRLLRPLFAPDQSLSGFNALMAFKSSFSFSLLSRFRSNKNWFWFSVLLMCSLI